MPAPEIFQVAILCFPVSCLMHQIFESFLIDLEAHKNDTERTEVEQYRVDRWTTCDAAITSLKKLEIA